MYCPNCGTQNDDNAWKCIKCGAIIQKAAPPPQQAPTQISNYLVQAILCTIFCCLPFGITAIVFAAQVNTKIAAGDIQGAMASSEKAKMWCWISFGTGIVVGIIYIIAAVLSRTS